MIHGVFGKLGAGKGKWIMSVIADELIKGFRDVVTNLPLKFEPWVNGQGVPQIGLRAYLVGEKGIEPDIADTMLKRCLVVDDPNGLWDMFMWRRDGDTHQWFKMAVTQNDEKGKPMMFDPNEAKNRRCQPCLVVSDEAWFYYPNNGGWNRAPLIGFYGRQQRKLRDEWYIITQDDTDVDSMIWNITQDFFECINHGMLRMGIFRQPDMFRVICYRTRPSKGNPLFQYEIYQRLDAKGLVQCYDTTGGIGFSGGFAGDAGQKRKGLSFYWLGAGVVAFVVLLCFVPHLTSHWGSMFIRKAIDPSMMKKMPSAAPSNAPALPSSSLPGEFRHQRDLNSTNQVSDFRFPTGDSPDDTNSVWCTGIAILSKDDVTAFFSDGSTAFSSEGEIQKIKGRWVYAFGKKYRLCTAPPHSEGSRQDEIADSSHIVDYGQNNLPDAPVNEAIILPSINSAASGLQAAPRVNGMGSMSSSQAVEHSDSQIPQQSY